MYITCGLKRETLPFPQTYDLRVTPTAVEGESWRIPSQQRFFPEHRRILAIQ